MKASTLYLRTTLGRMTLDLREYSAAKIDCPWTKEDHQFLLASLERIEKTCIDVWQKIREESKGEPKSLRELLSSVETESPSDTHTFDLPFADRGTTTDEEA